MTTRLLLTLLLLTPFNIFAENQKILELLNEQVEAFNQRDVARLVNNVTDDFKWFSLTSDALLVETDGKASFKKSMENYYQSRPKTITSSIEKYTIDGNRISFKEVVRHLNKTGKTVSSSAMGIYEIRGDKIYRAWYFIDE